MEKKTCSKPPTSEDFPARQRQRRTFAPVPPWLPEVRVASATHPPSSLWVAGITPMESHGFRTKLDGIGWDIVGFPSPFFSLCV